MTPRQKEVFCELWLKHHKRGSVSRLVAENIFTEGCNILIYGAKATLEIKNESLKLQIKALQQELKECREL